MSQSTTNIFETKGIRLPADAFVVIVRTAWNAHVVDILEQGARKVLEEKGVEYLVLEVPGAVEIPFAINSFWAHQQQKTPAAFIALGCVIRGDTPHFDYVCKSVTDGITQLNISLPVPTIFGILTVNDQLQADERTGGRHGHKGEEAAATAIRMMALKESFRK